MTKPDDIVTRTLATVRERAPQTEQEWRDTEHRLRQEWGGSSAYVWKPLVPTKAERVAALLAQGVPLPEARRKLGVTRQTAWRALSLRWSLKP